MILHRRSDVFISDSVNNKMKGKGILKQFLFQSNFFILELENMNISDICDYSDDEGSIVNLISLKLIVIIQLKK